MKGFNAAAVADNDTALAMNLGLSAGLLCINATAHSPGNATAARWTSASLAIAPSGQSSTNVLTVCVLHTASHEKPCSLGKGCRSRCGNHSHQ